MVYAANSSDGHRVHDCHRPPPLSSIQPLFQPLSFSLHYPQAHRCILALFLLGLWIRSVTSMDVAKIASPQIVRHSGAENIVWPSIKAFALRRSTSAQEVQPPFRRLRHLLLPLLPWWQTPSHLSPLQHCLYLPRLSCYTCNDSRHCPDGKPPAICLCFNAVFTSHLFECCHACRDSRHPTSFFFFTKPCLLRGFSPWSWASVMRVRCSEVRTQETN